eukprot:TRINITY_DN1692_c0_g3_i1.p1 TRINITY_DN1692_c0_g3~~TRINITY_DN1692_c0_g3_i1.p1  ORF type:complete len:140 (+),score=40.32 TRINITY_DN1692_c0_g3_i1:54-422(+)
MSVALNVVLPSKDVLTLEATGSTTVLELKKEIANLANLDVSTLIMTHDGEELGSEDDTRKVMDCAFEDQSELTVGISVRTAIIEHLKECGWTTSADDIYEALAHFDNPDNDDDKPDACVLGI